MMSFTGIAILRHFFTSQTRISLKVGMTGKRVEAAAQISTSVNFNFQCVVKSSHKTVLITAE